MSKQTMLDKETIKQIALANGFKLKEQADGRMDLNPYVYEFTNAIAKHCWSAFKSGVMPHKIHPTKASLNNGWISVDDWLPDDESKDDYLAYSIHTEVYEKVDIKKLKMMIANSAKITHWQPLPQPPKE